MTWLNDQKRWAIPVLLLALIVVVGLVVTRRPMPVQVIALEPGLLVRTLQFSGRVATLSRVDVGSTVTGRVVEVPAREGAQVRRGQVLIRLETQELKAAVEQAEAAERQAQATLQATQATLQRATLLVVQNFYSAAQLDDAQRALDVAAAQQAAARATLTATRARLDQARIQAPADARVLARLAEPGQIVQPGRALMTLALAGPTQLVAQVDERFLDQLRVGQPAMVVADAFAAQPFAAHVQSLSPLVDAQRGAIEVKFALDQRLPDFLREDMTLSIEVETGRRERSLVVPLAALQGASSPYSPEADVQVAQNGQVQQRRVRLGLRAQDAVEVLGGLAAGDQVLLQPVVRGDTRVRAQVVAWKPGSVDARVRGEDAGAALTNAMGR